jgi:hypothetical protein
MSYRLFGSKSVATEGAMEFVFKLWKGVLKDIVESQEMLLLNTPNQVICSFSDVRHAFNLFQKIGNTSAECLMSVSSSKGSF